MLSFWELENEVSSPTFTIVNEYIKEDINIYHLDVYRLSGTQDFYAIGGQEYLENGICIIEWGEIIENILPQNYIKVTFYKDEKDENTRLLEVETNNDRLDNIIKELRSK